MTPIRQSQPFVSLPYPCRTFLGVLTAFVLCSLTLATSSLAQTPPPQSALTSTDVVKLIIKVVDVKGRGLGNARVSVMRDGWGPDWRAWDYTAEADANGVAVLNVSLGAASWAEGTFYWPVLRVDATKGGITESTQLKVVGKRLWSVMKYPTELTHTVVLKETGKEIKVVVTVLGDDKKEVEGASVLVRDLSARAGGDRGVTGADGKVVIPVSLYGSGHQITATRDGYKPGETGLTLLPEHMGKTVTATITMSKGPTSGVVEVTVETTNGTTQLPAADVEVTFTGVSGSALGAYKGTTDSNGRARLKIPGYGTFTVKLSQDTFEPKQEQVKIDYGEEQKKFNFTLTEKATGDESVAITVFAGDVKNGRGGFQPIKGASVTAGKVKSFTDGNGQVTLDAKAGIIETSKREGYVEAVNVKVSAPGYLSQSRSVAIQRRGRNLEGSGSGNFILQPGEDPVSDDTPLTLVVEVLDRKTKPIKGASVTFSLANDTKLFGGRTDAAGKRDFSSSDHSPDQELATLRRGLKVKVTHPGYKDHESSVTAGLLIPKKESHYSVQLDKDWSELEQELAALEKEVNVWRGQPQVLAKNIKAAHELGDKCAAARVRADGVLSELKTALKTFDAKSLSSVCKEATDMAQAIEALQVEAKWREERLVAALKDATDLAARCKTAAESETILSKHKEAIKLIGEMGVFGRKAMEINEKRNRLLESTKDDATRPEQLREQLDKIQKEFETAEKDAARAGDLFRSAVSTSKSLLGQQARLTTALDDLRAKHKVKENLELIPKEILQRLDNVDSALSTFNDDASFGTSPNAKWLEVVKDDVRRIQQARIDASELLSGVKKSLCDTQPRNEAVEEIRTRVTNSGFELGLAADLPAKAQACANAVAAASPTPAPVTDYVIVPDLSLFDGLTEMQTVARHAGLVPVLAATTATPAPGKKGFYVTQNPLPNTRAPKKSVLKIYVSQMIAAPSATPTPPKAAAASPSASPEDDMVTVPPVVGAESIEYARIILNQAGFGSSFKATKPSKKSEELTIAGSFPEAGKKAKRGSLVNVFIYQKFEDASPTPTPTSIAAATSSPTPGSSDTVPSLIGLTLAQAVSRLPSNMRIGGDEVGDKPPGEEKAYTIFSQNPPANSKVSSTSNVVVTVKRYGSANVAAVEPTPATESSGGGGDFAGTWQGNLWSIAGSLPTVLEIRRSGNGYSLLWYSPNDRKSAAEYPARVVNGRLVLELDIDLALTVGAFGSSASEMGAKYIMKFRYTFTLNGDTLTGEMWAKDTVKGEEATRPNAGTMHRK